MLYGGIVVGIGKKKKKRKTNYYVVTISDNPKMPAQASRFTHGARSFWGIIITVLVVVVVTFVALINYRSSVLTERENAYKASVVKLQQEVAELEKENDSLRDKISILSATVNEKSEVVNAIEERYVPSGFPLSVAANLSEKEEKVSEAGEEIICPTLEFTAQGGTFVLAAGEGRVLSVNEYAEDDWEIRIDHSNGYVSVYDTDCRPSIKAGDDVAKGAPLGKLGADKKEAKLKYRIILNGDYIDPRELLEIHG